MRTLNLTLVLAALAAVSGCESMGTAAQSQTTQGAVMGGLLGAGTGAIIGNQSHHHAGAGAAIGGALGALGGGMIGHGLEEQRQAAQQQAYPPATTSTATTTRMKFCPVGGELYPETVKYCPIHGAELRYRDDSPPAQTP